MSIPRGGEKNLVNCKNMASAFVQEVILIHICIRFISPDGSDSNSGTQQSPFLTLSAAIDAASNYDVVGGMNDSQ